MRRPGRLSVFELILKMFSVVEVRFLKKAVEFFHFNLGKPFFVHMDMFISNRGKS